LDLNIINFIDSCLPHGQYEDEFRTLALLTASGYESFVPFNDLFGDRQPYPGSFIPVLGIEAVEKVKDVVREPFIEPDPIIPDVDASRAWLISCNSLVLKATFCSSSPFMAFIFCSAFLRREEEYPVSTSCQ
jgi:hypothetical protein